MLVGRSWRLPPSLPPPHPHPSHSLLTVAFEGRLQTACGAPGGLSGTTWGNLIVAAWPEGEVNLETLQQPGRWIDGRMDGPLTAAEYFPPLNGLLKRRCLPALPGRTFWPRPPHIHPTSSPRVSRGRSGTEERLTDEEHLLQRGEGGEEGGRRCKTTANTLMGGETKPQATDIQ